MVICGAVWFAINFIMPSGAEQAGPMLSTLRMLDLSECNLGDKGVRTVRVGLVTTVVNVHCTSLEPMRTESCMRACRSVA